MEVGSTWTGCSWDCQLEMDPVGEGGSEGGAPGCAGVRGVAGGVSARLPLRPPLDSAAECDSASETPEALRGKPREKFCATLGPSGGPPKPETATETSEESLACRENDALRLKPRLPFSDAPPEPPLPASFIAPDCRGPLAATLSCWHTCRTLHAESHFLRLRGKGYGGFAAST